jgi:hypothetical protein
LPLHRSPRPDLADRQILPDARTRSRAIFSAFP